MQIAVWWGLWLVCLPAVWDPSGAAAVNVLARGAGAGDAGAVDEDPLMALWPAFLGAKGGEVAVLVSLGELL